MCNCLVNGKSFNQTSEMDISILAVRGFLYQCNIRVFVLRMNHILIRGWSGAGVGQTLILRYHIQPVICVSSDVL